eukprot:1196409-Prorocentrum_minimum.AAC.2
MSQKTLSQAAPNGESVVSESVSSLSTSSRTRLRRGTRALCRSTHVVSQAACHRSGVSSTAIPRSVVSDCRGRGVRQAANVESPSCPPST